MKKYFLSIMPSPNELYKSMQETNFPEYREVNAHIHTPYSFSAFDNLESAFSMAKKEGVSVLGINDFLVTDGYEEFYRGSVHQGIFPLFNIEFLGLLKSEKEQGIRINDPANPGRIYFYGKGLDYPFKPQSSIRKILDVVIDTNQNQIKKMISRLNILLQPINDSHILTYEGIKDRYAKHLVSEHHLAKALILIAYENYSTPEEQIRFIEAIYGGQKSTTTIHNKAELENEIRSKLLEAGGEAYVEEDEDSFLDLKAIRNIIIKSGGIPCYPVLLDDHEGNFTEFESGADNLYSSLTSLNIGCIEFIPGKNDHTILKSYVEYFHKKGFIILFGTEHNTHEMIHLTVKSRGSDSLDNTLKIIGWEGACVIAAHQYLRARKEEGYMDSHGTLKTVEKQDYIKLGKLVIEHFLNQRT